MHYRPEILSLYADLFEDAHASFQKEAAGEGMLRRLINRFHVNPRQLRQAEGTASAFEDALTSTEDLLSASQQRQQQLQQAIDDAAARMHGMESDIGGYRKALESAEGDLLKRERELKELGAEPGQLQRLKTMARGGLALGLAGGVGAPIAYGLGRSAGEDERKRTRNIAFGAGAATGLAAPKIIRGLGRIAGNTGQGQTNLYPSMGYPNEAY